MARSTRDATRAADAATGWVAQLRSGGVEPWTSWRERSGAPLPDRAARVPGAQQLELLRRLNLFAQSIGTRAPAVLVERVLAASAPGRGIPDLPLAGATSLPHRFGPHPVDPETLAVDELVRVASGLIADDLATAQVPTRPVPPLPIRLLRERRLPWARGYRLAGDPWLMWPALADLVRRGRGPGGRRPQWVVLGTDLATMLAHAWTVRSFDTGAIGWDDWLVGVRSTRRLPRRADVLAAVRRSVAQVGADRVTLVLDPAELATVLGARHLTAPPRTLGANAADLGRRVAAPLGGLVLPERRSELLRTVLLPRLIGVGEGGAPLAVPERHEHWVTRRATRMRDGVVASGARIVGDPDVLLRGPTPGGATPDADGILELALRLLLDGPAPTEPTGSRTNQKGDRPR